MQLEENGKLIKYYTRYYKGRFISEKSLKEKLYLKFDKSLVDKFVLFLIKEGYVNDKYYLHLLVESYKKRYLGYHKVLNSLKRKKLQYAGDINFNKEDDLKACYKYYEKISNKNYDKIKSRNILYRQGYIGENIDIVLEDRND